MNWQVVHTLAAVLSATVACCSVLLAWWIYRKASSNTLIDAIKNGDKVVCDRLDDIEDAHDQRLRTVESDLRGIKAAQDHGIQRADVEKLHHRINVLVREVSGVETLAKASGAQLDRIQTYLMGHNK